jgi:LacI family transcriptional regulator
MKNTKTIGIIMPDVMNLFFSELARGAEDAAEGKGYSVILCNSDNKESKEERYIQILQEKMVDGIILTASESSARRSLERRKIPLVLLDRDISIDIKVGRITVDNEEGAYNATNYLIEKGCRDIGFISSDKTNKSSGQRLRGYERAILESKLELDKDKVFLQNYTIETGYKGTISLLERTNMDGIVCGNDLIAIGAIKALKERGMSVPKDVKVTGFDDISISKYMDPPLTTVRQPIYQMGEEAVKMLIDIIENKEVKMNKVLKTELIIRETT